LARVPDGPVSATSVGVGFEDAVSQCRKHCAAVHRHCQKHNTCHRDVDFEVDIDLLSNKRMCLEGLDLSVADDELLDPKSSRRVRVGFLALMNLIFREC